MSETTHSQGHPAEGSWSPPGPRCPGWTPLQRTGVCARGGALQQPLPAAPGAGRALPPGQGAGSARLGAPHLPGGAGRPAAPRWHPRRPRTGAGRAEPAGARVPESTWAGTGAPSLPISAGPALPPPPPLPAAPPRHPQPCRPPAAPSPATLPRPRGPAGPRLAAAHRGQGCGRRGCRGRGWPWSGASVRSSPARSEPGGDGKGLGGRPPRGSLRGGRMQRVLPWAGTGLAQAARGRAGPAREPLGGGQSRDARLPGAAGARGLSPPRRCRAVFAEQNAARADNRGHRSRRRGCARGRDKAAAGGGGACPGTAVERLMSARGQPLPAPVPARQEVQRGIRAPAQCWELRGAQGTRRDLWEHTRGCGGTALRRGHHRSQDGLAPG